MKKTLILGVLFTLLFCCNDQNKQEREYYFENQTSFFDLRNSDWTKNVWVRKPENLKMIHESFKKIGYSKLNKLIFKSEKEFLVQNIYIKRNFWELIDSLQLTYNKPETQSKYYFEFWKRRKLEDNDSIVFEIIKELNSTRLNDSELKYEPQFVNDTLVELLKIEFDNNNLNSEKAEFDFYTLKNYGFNQSAYNLLYERSEYSEFDFEREKLKKELAKSKELKPAWLIDNTK